jgi:hypothetical protein
MQKLSLVIGVALVASTVARADEGMWTFNNFPKQAVKKHYRFDVTDPWLDHVRLASVRFNSGGSGAFVSGDGLVMTNHHVGADCIHKLANPGADYIKNGFVARTNGEEIKCPDLELNVVTAIEDVTQDVVSVAQPGMDDAAINKAEKEKSAQIEKACADKTHARCDVVALYKGALHNLYTYKKYTDVRLVFAPEFQIAFFGGDPDNFEFPRYDLDVAYFRAYENGAPVHSEYFKWSPSGAKDGELVFVPGNPGATDRLSTVAELETLRDVSYPLTQRVLAAQRQALEAYAAKGAEEARQSERRHFGIMNNVKRMKGYLGGLQDAKIMAKKATEEAALKKSLAGDAQYAKVWDDIAAVQARWTPSAPRYSLQEKYPSGSELLELAQHLVRLTAEKQKPNEKRFKEYRETAIASLELRLFSPAPLYDGLEETLLTSWLEVEQKELGAADPYVQKLLGGKTPAARAHELVAGTKLKDVAVRKQLAASKAAVDGSTDPLIVLARAIDPDRRAIRKQFEDSVEAPLHHDHELIAKAQFATAGLSHYPDATFTLRLSFGKVAGYTQAGKKIPPQTTMAGLYQRADKAKGAAPWDVPPRWVDAKSKVDGKVPMDFVSTNDIIGGNSGSPVINAKGEIVGLIFDGNIQSLPGNFVYDDTQNRAVSVHSSALLEALRHVYDAGFLADELAPPMGKKRASR